MPTNVEEFSTCADFSFCSPGISPMSCSSGRQQIGGLGKQSSQSRQAEAVLFKNEACNESGSTSLAVNCVYNNIGQRIEKGTMLIHLIMKNQAFVNKT